VFDLEVLYGPDEAGGWGRKDRMGVAVAVALALGRGEFTVYWGDGSPGLDDLCLALSRAPFVIGWNHVGFDYAVLRAAGHAVRQPRNADLQRIVQARAGGRASGGLDGVARATLGRGKGRDSALLPRMFRQGDRELVAAECRLHVELTAELYRFAEARGFLRLADGSSVRIPRAALRPGPISPQKRSCR